MLLMLSVVILSIIMLSDILLSLANPKCCYNECLYAWSCKYERHNASFCSFSMLSVIMLNVIIA
jgi:hypothetical protein